MLSDAERNAYFDRKSKEVIERFLGKEKKFPIPDPIETRITSPIGESWYDKPRILKDMNPSAFDPWLRDYNRERQINNGKIVTHVETPLEEAVPDPIK